MNHSKIGTLEAIMLIVCVIIIHTVLSLPKTLIDLTKLTGNEKRSLTTW